jgi:hypothetical protein
VRNSADAFGLACLRTASKQCSDCGAELCESHAETCRGRRDAATSRQPWNERIACVSHDLPLAATVMMGGILEALLIARINKLSDQSPVFKAKSAPKDKTTGAVLKLREWTLSNYIDVAHETRLDFGHVQGCGRDPEGLPQLHPPVQGVPA